MTLSRKRRGPARRLTALLGLILCTMPAFAEPPASAQMQPAEFAPAIRRTDSIPGPYEVLAVPELGAVFSASVPDFTDGAPGDIYMLSADSLQPIRRIQLQRRPFALAIDHKRGRLYAGNTKDGSLAVIDAASGVFLRTIQLGKPGPNGKMEHTRMIEVDEATGHVFVTGPTDEGIVWIVDPEAGEILHRLDNVAIWAAGLAYDGSAGAGGRLYVGGGGAEEIVVLDAATGARITSFSTGDTPPGQGDISAHFMVNLSLDAAGGRLFAVDSHKGCLYVFDVKTGAILAQVPIGPGALDVIYNPARNEAYVTYYGINREITYGSGGLVVVDAATYTIRQDLAIETFPSNLSLDATGQVLFASVTQPSAKAHPNYRPGAVGSVIRLDLATLSALGN